MHLLVDSIHVLLFHGLLLVWMEKWLILAERGLLLVLVWPEAIAIVISLLHVHHELSLVLSDFFDDALLELLEAHLVLHVL